LEPIDYVHAFWEGGAVAFNRVDEWSDIDAYVAVDDDKVDEAFLVVEKALKSLSPIKQKLNVPQTGWPGVSQAFYRLEDASEYLVIDFVVLKLGSPTKFLEPEIHGNNVFYFNKSNKVSIAQMDKDALIKRMQARLDRLKVRFEMFNYVTQKEINRGNYLEALDTYYNLTLASLVEALRMKHNPVHFDFRMRYIHYEIPSEVVEKLEHLYFVEDEKDLQEKYDEATKWFQEVISEIERKKTEKLIRVP